MGWHSFYSLEGRALRSEYWLLILLAALIAVAALVVAEFVFGISIFTKEAAEYNPVEAFAYYTLSIGLVFVIVPVTLRRLHDRNKGLGWLILYTASSISIDAVDILSLRFLELPQLGEQVIYGVYMVAGLISLFSLVDLGFLRGTEGINNFGPDPLVEPVGDPTVFD